MKPMLYQSLALILLIVTSCSSVASEKESTEATKSIISFEEKLHDFGNIAYESDGRCYFEFTNISETNLIINNVRTSCGCTRPSWPEEPIAPGKTGRIGISYNTKITGKFSKTITVYSNAESSPTKLFIKGNVEEKPSK